MDEEIIRKCIEAHIKGKVQECNTVYSKVFFSTFKYLKDVFTNDNGEDIFTIIDRQSNGSNWLSIRTRQTILNSDIEISGQYNNIDFITIITKMIDEQINKKREEYDTKTNILSKVKTDTQDELMKGMEYVHLFRFQSNNIIIDTGYAHTEHSGCTLDSRHILKAIRDNNIL